MKDIRWKLAALAAAAIVAACGGGETADGPSNKVGINAMVTFGDSLSDIGSYNVGSIAGLGQATGGAGRFTVNATTGGQIWTERIAALLPVPTTCSAQTGMYPNIPGLVGAPATAKANCFNYAQGGSRVTSPLGIQSFLWQGAPFNQYNLGFTTKPVKDQMSAHLTASGGSYTGKELVTVLAGANDVFVELGSVAAGAQTPQAAVTNVATAGAELGAYIKSMVVAKGAKQVLVVNMPYVAGTPFGQHLDAQTRGLVDAMTTAFNAQLAAQLAGVSGVILGDFYSEFKAMVSDPAQYALTNVTTPVCGPNALSNPADAPGSSLVCNASNVIKGDISHYAFADDVHPTPYGHQLLSQFASRLMAQAGWL
ncbi:SGNH/GDSL hydrolase family protein [Candidatus Skiveiella danica]|jgi:outer membrane lipase/esterase|uniref:SGNH/GDSL hydrolase family protein n=1 Tax=Candidatus Skiveiella danica TaxID=3386177 RepID=UPI0009CE22B9|nr:MAG: GDSL-like Lipase/Acylhydrolase [Alphaproteobacteria bacterium ADurb.Bin100]